MKQKQAYDLKSFKQKNPPETIENFLYIYFSQKYGLKEMIKVQVSSVIDKIQQYSNESPEIEAFRRILKNQVDEKFYWFLQDMKANTDLKIKNFYKNKVRKHASLVDQESFLKDKKEKGLNKKEGCYVIEESYSGREQKKILNQFRIYHDEQSTIENEESKLDY